MFSFFGWIFESSYVSIINKRPVNRGFLIGPWIPIYGFGGVIMLFVAIPFYYSPALVFIVGLAAASTLEYFTGIIMEKIFAVKYWDYTGKPFASKNGYICLESSLCWGVFTLILTYAGAKWIDGFIYDLHIKNLSQMVAKANAEMREVMDKMPEDLIDIRNAFEAARADGHITKAEWDDLIGRAMAAAGDRLEKGREELGERIGSISSSLETAKTTVGRRMDARAAFRKEAVVDAAKRFESVLAKRQKSVLSMDMLTKRMLKGNPSASSSLEGFDVIKKNAMEEAVQK